jgi:short-subunit dehydrogenase
LAAVNSETFSYLLPGKWVTKQRCSTLTRMHQQGSTLISLLLPHLMTLPQSRLVFVGSVLGHIGLPGHAVYGASKSALHGFAEALRRELTDTSVRVQWLAPRATETDFNDALAQEFNRLTGTPSDAVGVVAQALVKLLRSSSAERVLGWSERLGVRLNASLGARMDRAFITQAQVLHRLFSVKS